ncbi:copper resistance CopC family protein [Spirillospora albida]|uniref:copper resistance CopC family protein n=1 Tax=Spirillospora albida TaxID=58123 RepID=UPI0004C26C2D|nr:copper resistance protein CopC [Spirillospora albida]
MKRLVTALAIAWTVIALTAAPASAHTALKSSDPAKGATVEAPSEIVLTYTDAVMLPKVALTDASGKVRSAGAPRAVDDKVVLPVTAPLPAGVYTVGWRVVSADGHPVAGSFRFTVKASESTAGSPPSTGAAPTSAAPSAPAPTAAPADSGGSSGWLWIGLIAAGIAAVAGAVALLRRRSG